MTNLNRQLGIYSTKKKNHLKQIIKKLIILTSLVTLFLIGQQIFLRIKNSQRQIIAPKEENLLETISQLCQKNSMIIDSIEEKPDMIRLLLESEAEVILDKKKPIGSQIDALQLIINQDKMNGRKAKKIDFRFNNPIVIY